MDLGEQRVRTYQGRPLARPGEEVVDQGLGFDLVTLGRRQLLRAFGLGVTGLGVTGLGATALGLAACDGGSGSPSAAPSPDRPGSTGAGATGASGEIPDETAGPYPGDGSNGPNVLDDSGIVRGDIRTS